MTRPVILFVSVLCAGSIALTAGCGEGGGGGGDSDTDTDTDTDTDSDTDSDTFPDLEQDWDRDIVSTALELDLDGLTGTATIVIAAAESTTTSFEAQGLDIYSVADGDGGEPGYAFVDGALTVEVPTGGEDPVIVVDYGFGYAADFEGYLASGVSFTWPYFCGNLFPCHSEPRDGLTFELAITGVGEPYEAVFPTAISHPAPSYQLAFAVGDYSYTALGTTTDGTEIGVWWLPGGEAAALSGTADLVAAFDWLEQTLGPYPFGDEAAAVAVAWSGGGMEHHPYWHVGAGSMADATTQIHEAAHGWYGDGIRIECWEDFVLSEGTVTYLAARAIEEAVGAAEGQAVWDSYASLLEMVLQSEVQVAWPDSCDELDILDDGIFSWSPYMKGAFFYRAVADQVGVDVLDGVLAGFFELHVGESALMQDMIDQIDAETGFDPSQLAYEWLQTLGAPK